MTEDAIIKLLRERAFAISLRTDGEPGIHPVATLDGIEAAEIALGVNLPPLLKRIYLEIGNGGCMLGNRWGLAPESAESGRPNWECRIALLFGSLMANGDPTRTP